MSARRSAERTIVHVDMDAFFVAVELIDAPELRGRPVVVGGAGSRGVVAAASYEARSRGVRSAMPSVQARRLCPDAVFLAGRHHRYAEVSARIMEVFRSFTPLVEPISLDEAFLDLTGAQRLWGDGRTVASSIRRAVLEAEGLVCSVGVAPNKFVAKVASEAAKPHADPRGPRPGAGVVVVRPDEVLTFLHPMEVSVLWGVGPSTRARLERVGVRTVGDLARLPEDALTAALGRAAGHHLHALAHGIDERDVEPDRAPKSIGHEQTYPRDLTTRSEVGRELVRLADGVAARLRASELRGRTVTLKVRFADFRTITRSVTSAEPVDTTSSVLRLARQLADEVDIRGGVRLLGVSAGNLDGLAHQLSFEELSGTDDTRRRAERAMDTVRARWGRDAIGPAALLDPGPAGGKRPGEDLWGPQK